MSSVINTNAKSVAAQNALVTNNRKLETAMQQLSTGKRINGAKDDAAGLSIASKMTSYIKGLDQGVRNANDAISLLQTYEGAAVEIENMLQRMRELAVQAASDTNVTADRTAIDNETDALSLEITRIATDTKWNGTSLMSAATTFTFHIGADNATTSALTFVTTDLDATALSVNAIDVSSNSAANLSIGTLTTALASVASARSAAGAAINRLTYAADNLANISMNTQASRSRVQDTDYAKATTELASRQIIQQAATAMLAQANQEPQSVLSLLK